MRILHLYAGNLYGGIETFLSTWAELRHLCPELDSEFGLCFRGRLWSELSAAGATVYDLGAVRFSRPWTVLKARRNLKTLLKQHRFDVVATHANWPHAVFAPTVRAVGLPVVNFVHDVLRNRSWLDRFARMTPPDFAIANSHFTAQHVSNVFDRVPVETVYLPVHQSILSCDVASRNRIRDHLQTSHDSTVLIQVSRMEELKGTHVTLRALSELKQSRDWTAWFVGGSQRPSEKAYEHRLKTHAMEYGIQDRVRFLGQRSDVPQLLAAADLFCQPNVREESFGIVFIEALRAGLPVITTNIGGGAEIVTPECGQLVPANDAVELAQAIGKYLQPTARPTSRACRSRAHALCDPKTQLASYYSRMARLAPTKSPATTN